MEIWTHSYPPSPPLPPPALPWSFTLQNERIAALGIDASAFNVKCYDKAIDGTTTGTWHERCKYHGPTILLLELSNGKVLGAYSSISMSDLPTIDDFGNHVGHTENNKYASSDSQAFLFALPPEGVYGDGIKLPVKTSSQAFYEYPSARACQTKPPHACLGSAVACTRVCERGDACYWRAVRVRVFPADPMELT